MYCIIYEFIIEPEYREKFCSAWHDLTLCIKLECASLGSRLHQSSAPNRYIAYAQWPSKEHFHRAQQTVSSDREALSLRMRSYLVSSRVMEELEVCDNQLTPD